MSYYVLPKIKVDYQMSPVLYNVMDQPKPCISSSLINYTKESDSILQQQLSMDCNVNISFRMLTQIIHGYDFLFSCVSGLGTPVTSVQANSPMYFDIVEIFQTLKLGDKILLKTSPIHILCCGKNAQSALDAFKFQCEDMQITYKLLDQFKSCANLTLLGKQANSLDYYENFEHAESMKGKCDLMYFEESDKNFVDVNEYVLYLTKAMLFANMYQSRSGCLIIKISTIFYKPIVDLIYIISHMYKKIYIMKPNTSNVILDDRYLVCKTFCGESHDIMVHLRQFYNSLFNVKNDVNVSSILKNKLYYYFLNKVEESNVIIGQQKLDAYSQLINLLKSKNKMEKIELLQRHNVQKCVYWCDKHKIEHNKISDKMNMFVPLQHAPPDGDMTTGMDVDDVFYSYIATHYGDVDNDAVNEDEEEYVDIIDAIKLSSYNTKKKRAKFI